VLRHAVSDQDKYKTEGENFLLKTLPLANYIVESREFTLFKDMNSFKDLVAQPDQFISPLAALGGDADQTQNLPRIPEGMEVRVKSGEKDGATWGGLEDVATTNPERVYRVEIITEVGAVKKRLTAVYDMDYQRSQSANYPANGGAGGGGGQSVAPPNKTPGTWLYIREE
jgi:hypothetical protein